MALSISLMKNMGTNLDVLGFGLSAIVLNLGMYLGVPITIFVGIK